jgi:hypothetical protein
MGRNNAVNKDDSITWFGSSKIRYKIRRLLPPEYLKRFPLYFEQYGCIHCKRRDVPHCANGLCAACNALIRLRFDRIGKRLSREKRPLKSERASIYLRKVSSARDLLLDILGDPAHKKFLQNKSSLSPVAYLGKKSNYRVFNSDFDTGKVSWKRPN